VSTTQIIVLAIVQGLTEFLPISSSGHLNLVHLLSVWPDEGPLIDVSVHFGSLIAVLVYFWRETFTLIRGALDLLRLRWGEEARLAAWLALASVPVFIAGAILLYSGAINSLRTIAIVAVANLVFAIVLYFADRAPQREDMARIGLGRALMIGFSQVLALIPGVSRSGITITTARFMGINRFDAARFSMLLAIPTILGASAGSGYEIYRSGDLALQNHAVIAALASFATAYIAIWAMMAWLRKASFAPFVVYRIVLSAVLLAVLAFS